MESSSWSENLPTDRKKAVEKLIRGRKFANQLRGMLAKPFQEEADGSSESDSEDIIVNIMRSFIDGLKSEDSSESCETSAAKDRRECYKRRKTSNTWTRVSPTLIDDGYAWRKYGQKMILNAKYPRNYFRCTHKFDQGCQATKQVLRIEDEPVLYRTTYHGDHTCHNLLNAPQLTRNSSTASNPSTFDMDMMVGSVDFDDDVLTNFEWY